jgi:uncharacterized protein with PQ loop repeat
MVLLIFSYFFGFLAIFISIFSFLPQFLKVKRTKNTTSISVYSYMLFVTANILWLSFSIISLINYLVNKMSLSPSTWSIAINLIWNTIIFIPYSFTTYFSIYILITKINNIKKHGEDK